jgi:hypothetical protein
MCSAQPPPPFRASNNNFRYTTKELLNLTAQRTTSKEAAGPLPVLGGREMVPNSAVQGAMKDVKGGKKSQKCHPQWAAAAASRDNDDDGK